MKNSPAICEALNYYLELITVAAAAEDKPENERCAGSVIIIIAIIPVPHPVICISITQIATISVTVSFIPVVVVTILVPVSSIILIAI